MTPNVTYSHEAPEFWALVRYASQEIGYSNRTKRGGKANSLRQFLVEDVKSISGKLGIDDSVIRRATDYLNYRADALEQHVEKQLMNREQAAELFIDLKKQHSPSCDLPFNKQKGEKRHHAYFTCIINILTEAGLAGRSFIQDPRQLAMASDGAGKLVKTLSRRIDGAYPTLDNPIAIWEVKEYYGTTTFGSRVADGVYETQLDGYELREAEQLGSHHIEHYLLVDDYFTWWGSGRSYLCRLVDTMHMGLVDEVVFGREVVER